MYFKHLRIGLAVFLVLMAGGLLPRMSFAENNGDEEDIWGMFKDIATEKFYEKLDELFADISGVSVKEKLDKMQEAIEIAEKFANYFDKVIMAEPTRKADLEALKGLADGISAVSSLLKELPEPGPSLTAFFEFYAEGIYSAVRMMERLSEELRQKAIELAEIGGWDFSLYPGAISDEEIREIRKMKQQEMLAKRAKVAVEAKKARLEAKRGQIEEFINSGYPNFIRDFVQQVESLAGKGRGAYILKAKIGKLKEDYNLVFEVTDPRDAMEKQYSDELEELFQRAGQTIDGTTDYLSILSKASSLCITADNEIYYVGEIPDREDDSGIKAKITEIRGKVEELRNREVSFEGEVVTYEGAMERFGEIKRKYEGMKSEAESILEEAQNLLQMARDYKDRVIRKWEERGSDEEAAGGDAAIPYAIEGFAGSPVTLSADDITQRLLGIPRSMKLNITVLTVVVKQVLVAVKESYYDPETKKWKERTVMRRYYEFSEGPRMTTGVSLASLPRGIVSTSSERIKGIRKGKTTVTASVHGYKRKPSGRLRPEEYYSLPMGEIEVERLFYVMEYAGMKFEIKVGDYEEDYHQVSKADLFISEIAGIKDSNTAWIKPTFMFETPGGRSNRSLKAINRNSVGVVTSDDDVIPVVDYWGDWECYYVEAEKVGVSVLTFFVMDEEGKAIRGTEREITLRVSGMELQVNEKRRENLWWDVRAGDIARVEIKLKGNADTSEYEWRWIKLWYGGYEDILLLNETTAFSGKSTANFISLSPRAPLWPITARAELWHRGWNQKMFVWSFGIEIKPPKLKRVVLKVRYTRWNGSDWTPDESASLLQLKELHLFPWPFRKSRGVELIPIGYFSDRLISDVPDKTKTRLNINTEVEVDPPNASCISIEQIHGSPFYRLSKRPTRVGECSLSFMVPPVVDDKYFYNEETLHSANQLEIYADELYPLWSDHPMILGRRNTLRLFVNTSGELSDYEVVWSLDPDVGGLERQVTEFTQEAEGNWFSENHWDLPNTINDNTIQIKAMVRKKGSQIILGGVIESAEVSSAGMVLLNEVCPAGGWIEIFNPEMVDIPIAGYRLIDGDGQLDFIIPEEGEDWDGVLEPGGYLVIHLIPGLTFDTPGEDIQAEVGDVLDVNGDSVALLTPEGDEGDFMRYGDSADTPPSGMGWEGDNPPSPEGRQSLGRNKDSLDTDNGSDWESSGGVDAMSPTPGMSNLGYLLGDVSMNGRISAYDAMLVIRHLVGKEELNNTQLIIGDVTGEGDVTVLDAAMILRYVVGLIERFPAESRKE
jgi:hypothetical protein